MKFFVKLKAEELENAPSLYRDVTHIGHYGTGDSEFTATSDEDFQKIAQFIELAYNKVGG